VCMCVRESVCLCVCVRECVVAVAGRVEAVCL